MASVFAGANQTARENKCILVLLLHLRSRSSLLLLSRSLIYFFVSHFALVNAVALATRLPRGTGATVSRLLKLDPAGSSRLHPQPQLTQLFRAQLAVGGGVLAVLHV